MRLSLAAPQLSFPFVLNILTRPLPAGGTLPPFLDSALTGVTVRPRLGRPRFRLPPSPISVCCVGVSRGAASLLEGLSQALARLVPDCAAQRDERFGAG